MFDEPINSDRLYLVDDVGWQMVNPGKLPIRTRTLMVGWTTFSFLFCGSSCHIWTRCSFFGGKSRCWSQYTLEISLNIWTIQKIMSSTSNEGFLVVSKVVGGDFHSWESKDTTPQMPTPPIWKKGLIRSHQGTMMANNPLIRPDFFFWRWHSLGEKLPSDSHDPGWFIGILILAT